MAVSLKKPTMFLLVPMLVLGAIAIVLTPVPRWTRMLLQRSPACSVMNIVEGYKVKRHRHTWIDEIRKASRKLETDAAGFELWETPDGRWWIHRGESDDLFLVLAEQRSDIYRSAEVMVQAGDVVLDCGAHVGVFTRKALRAGARQVIAIEPDPTNIECIRRNAALEPRGDGVVAYPKGVWNKDDFLVMSDGGGLSGNFLKAGEPADRTTKLPLTTIDKLSAELALDRVDFIKMDIEGAEGRALEGAREVLRKYRPRLAIAGYHNREDGENLPSIVSRLQPGYKHFCEHCYSLIGIRPEVIFFH
jgi:FkbM family methyltransferase